MNYKRAIIIFGFVIPLLTVIVITSVFISSKQKITKKYKVQLGLQAQKDAKEEELRITEKETRAILKYSKKWEGLFDAEISGQVTAVMKKLQEKYSSKDLQQTSFSANSVNKGFGSKVSHPSAEVLLSFRGTYRAMQNALVEFESQLPHFQLDRMIISRVPKQERLSFQMNYTVWRK